MILLLYKSNMYLKNLMTLLDSDKTKINILKELYNQKTDLSMNSLRLKVGHVNYYSVARNIEFLGLLELIIIEKRIVENKTYNFIRITPKGKEFIEKKVIKK